MVQRIDDRDIPAGPALDGGHPGRNPPAQSGRGGQHLVVVVATPQARGDAVHAHPRQGAGNVHRLARRPDHLLVDDRVLPPVEVPAPATDIPRRRQPHRDDSPVLFHSVIRPRTRTLVPCTTRGLSRNLACRSKIVKTIGSGRPVRVRADTHENGWHGQTRLSVGPQTACPIRRTPTNEFVGATRKMHGFSRDFQAPVIPFVCGGRSRPGAGRRRP